MYETYVPIRVERKPPTIADIVREKTDDGARIVDFFLDLMEGRVDDARLCHRIDAAKQLVKYGSKEAADFIAEHGDETCDHCESRKRGPRPRKDASPAAGPLHAGPPHTPGPYGYDFLTLLTEDFFTVLSAVDEDLMIKLVRAQTRDGDAIVEFLDDVMHNRVDGFKANHRIAAARELISHILRDEHAFAHAVLDNIEPAPYSIRRAGLKPALPGAVREHGNHPSVVPAKAEGNPDNTIVVPAKAGTQRGGEGRSQPADNTIVVPAQAAIPEKCLFPRQPGAETHPRPRQDGAARAAIRRKAQQTKPIENDKDETPAPAEVVPARLRIKEKLVARWHEPDPWDRPIGPKTPGRSPPG